MNSSDQTPRAAGAGLQPVLSAALGTVSAVPAFRTLPFSPRAPTIKSRRAVPDCIRRHAKDGETKPCSIIATEKRPPGDENPREYLTMKTAAVVREIPPRRSELAASDRAKARLIRPIASEL